MKDKKQRLNLPPARHEPGLPQYIIVDGMFIAHTCNYAYGRLSYHGQSVSMLFGFMEMLKSKIQLNAWRMERLIVVWDGVKHPKRMEWLPDYKSHRLSQSINQLDNRGKFENQIRKLRRFLYYMGITQIHNKEVEGDDMIYWAVKKYSRLAKVTIISGDKDMLQLINRDVQVFNTRNNMIYTPELVKCTNYGTPLNQLLDFFCLTGDNSDDIPGIPGIKEARARTFLDRFGSFDNFIKNKKAEYSGMLDKERAAKIMKRNRRMIDLKWFNERYWTEDCITYYKDEQNPEFNEEKYIITCNKYGFKKFKLPNMINWLKSINQ